MNRPYGDAVRVSAVTFTLCVCVWGGIHLSAWSVWRSSVRQSILTWGEGHFESLGLMKKQCVCGAVTCLCGFVLWKRGRGVGYMRGSVILA